MSHIQQLDKNADNKKIIGEAITSLLRIKACADGRGETFASQGQPMDGYTELASYRDAIEKLENLT